jgi:hypothetical protein
MKLIFKRFMNTVMIFNTFILLLVFGAFIFGFTRTEDIGIGFVFFILLATFVFGINYVLLGSATLWHRDILKK